MAFYDWNNDGKKDMQDDFIEYNIYKNSTGKSNNTTGNHSSGGMSTFGAVICTIGILLFIGWIIGLAEPKCAHSGCDNSPADGSSYCWLHKSSSSSGYKSNNNSPSSSNYGNSSQSESSSTGTSNNTSTQSPTNKNNTSTSYKSNTGKSTYNSNKADDPYNAKDYSDAEDFYDDNYDDFDGYEDAEDYYDEWGE